MGFTTFFIIRLRNGESVVADFKSHKLRRYCPPLPNRLESEVVNSFAHPFADIIFSSTRLVKWSALKGREVLEEMQLEELAGQLCMSDR